MAASELGNWKYVNWGENKWKTVSETFKKRQWENINIFSLDLKVVVVHIILEDLVDLRDFIL